jgi:hypothetical protein
MLKKLWEPFKQFLALLLATLVAIFVAPLLAPIIRELIAPLYKNATNEDATKFIVPFLVPIIYLIGGVLHEAVSRLPVIGAILDKKSVFKGTYLSLPVDPDHLNLFTIESRGGKYQLVGYRYSFKAHKRTGHWNSEQLELKTTNPMTLIYNYVGEQYAPHPFSGRGFVKITFGEKPHSGGGYWIDVPDVVAPPPAGQQSPSETPVSHLRQMPTNYVKLTGSVKKEIIEKAVYFRGQFPFIFMRWFMLRKLDSVFDAFAARRGVLETKNTFQRP